MDWRNENLQLDVLKTLDMHFGEKVYRPKMLKTLAEYESDSDGKPIENFEKIFFRNMQYLEQHGLVNLFHRYGITKVECLEITAKGSDHLQLDGGLTAYFNKVTVRFDEDTLRAMMLKGVNESDLPEEEKNQAREILEKAGSGALQNITKDGLTELFKQMPNIVSFLQNLI